MGAVRNQANAIRAEAVAGCFVFFIELSQEQFCFFVRLDYGFLNKMLSSCSFVFTSV